MNEANIRNLEIVAEGLGTLVTQVVFVGGATVEFYAMEAGSPQVRPTIDVDCVVQMSSYAEYGKLEEVLRQKGFRNDRREGAPLCRWIYQDVVIDVMPTQTEALGFSNSWYAEGFEHTIEITLPSGQPIRILQLPYFLATKIEALESRGIDPRTSKDFEDIVFILRNRSTVFHEIQSAPDRLRRYICEACKRLLSRDNIDECIEAVLDFGEHPDTVRKIRNMLENISRMSDQAKPSGI